MLGQVEQILDIFDIGEDRAEDDQLDFSQFHSKVWFLKKCFFSGLNI